MSSVFTAEQLEQIRIAVCAWFEQSARALPWRENYVPYQVWVSEIMLQQTQVVTMLPYYRRWMARFPGIMALAEAPEEAVLKAWEGLGYYSRARNLHKAAKQLMALHGGRIPQSMSALRALPGVGAYTAGAVLSIGFNQSAPVVDGNVARVLGRLAALGMPAKSREGVQALWTLAEALVPPPPPPVAAWSEAQMMQSGRIHTPPPATSPRQFNQGLMELGALVCHAAKPDCPGCPLRPHCAGHAAGDPAAYPPPSRKPVRTEVEAVLLLAGDDERGLLMRKRPSGGLWGGLWEFPWEPLLKGESPEAALERVVSQWGLSDEMMPHKLSVLRHGLTHRRLTFHNYALPLLEFPEQKPPYVWANPHEREDRPLSELARKALREYEELF